MTDHLCPICARTDPADGLTVCRGCLDRLDDDLARIVELTVLAGGNIIPETRPGNGGRTVPGSRPPLSVAALDDCLGHGADGLPILGRLEDWIRLIREEAALAPYGAATEGHAVTVASSVAWLRSWLLWAAERPDFPIDDMAREVRELRQSLEHHDPDRAAPPAGTRMKCPADSVEADGTRCHGRIHYDREHPTQDIHCARCDTTWTGPRLLLLALGDDTQQIWAYPADILAIVDIPPATLRKWVQRGQLARDGGRYDIGQAWRWRMRVGA